MGAVCSSSQQREGDRALEQRRLKYCCSLADKGLKSVPPAAMESSNLLRLDLSHNQLCELPHTLGKLVNLQELLLPGNRLVGLPEQIGLCIALEKIQAANNRLATLPDSVGDLSRLRVLGLRDNLMQTVPSALGRCRQLRTLDVSLAPVPLSICAPSHAVRSHLMAPCVIEYSCKTTRSTSYRIASGG